MRSSSTSFQLEELYNQVEPDLKHDLSSACMPALSLEEFCEITGSDQIKEVLLKTKLSYSSQFGLEEARASVAKLYNLETENTMLTSGASEAIFLVMSTMFEAGDSIIVQKPIYQSLYQVAADRGVKVIDWNLKDYQWSINELAELIKKHPEVKALVINNPNNPTGLGFKAEELDEISKILKDRYLISDEVFLFISQSNLPSAIKYHHKSIVISDLSKSFNMPGLRLGWIAINRHCEQSEAIQTNCSKLKNYLSLRNNTLSETLSPYILDAAPILSKKNRELIKNNIDDLYSQESQIFDLSQISKDKIEGLCIFPYIKDGGIIDQLWDQERVFIAKGANFGENWGNYLRISLNSSPNIIKSS